MTLDSSLKPGFLVLSLLALSACSSGGGDGGDQQPTNRAPTANAGPDQAVDELSAVNLSGSGSDPDGDAITYSWSQRSGTAVTLAGGDTATPSFTAPDVTAVNTPDVLVFRLTVSDGSRTGSDDVTITVNDVGLGANSPPTADAGPDQNVGEQVTVNLDGTGSSDPDPGDTLSYSWVRTAGPVVALTGANTATPSFTSPDVAPGNPETITFELTVDDGTDTDADTVDIVVTEPAAAVNVAGQIFYERPTPNFRCRGFDFDNITNMPVRRATVLLLDAADNVLATTKSDDNGNYSFSGIDAQTDVRVRVRAELVQTSGPQTYEVYVRDNTSNIAAPLTNRPIYDIEWGLFNTGNTNISDADFVATTGWGFNSYTGVRQAAPLAILDSFLEGVLLIESVDDNVDMGRIDGFWSVNNSWVDDADDVDNGQLITAFYTSNPDGGARNPSLFLRGDAEGRFPSSIINTDEFDYGVVVHEWGHFFEDELARSDSIGGQHFIPGTVEARVAFGEGWGNAIAAIASNRPVTCDTAQPGSSGSQLDVENYNSHATEQGFFNEMSVATFLYDLFDTDVDNSDTGSVGFGPIYDTMTGFQRDTEAFTTLFSFGTGLLTNVNPGDVAFVESQLERENVDTGVGVLDIWGSNQVTAPANWVDGQPVRDLLPLYTELTPGGGTINRCVNDDEIQTFIHNAPGEWRYFRFTLASPQSLTLTIQANPIPPDLSPTADERDRSDPDAFLWRNGAFIGQGISSADDLETFNMGNLAAGTYVVSFHDWRYDDDDSDTDPPMKHPDYPSQVCFDFTLN